MFVNPLFFAALALGVALFWLGQHLSRRTPRRRWLLIVVSLLLCAPAGTFVAYYLHLFSEPLWYVDWRSRPGVELLSAVWGLLLGALTGVQASAPASRWRLSTPFIFAIAMLLVSVPYLKPLLRPVALTVPLANRWEDRVCLQSSDSTCGPAALATIFHHYDIAKTESEIARAAFSARGGTEIWYLLRYARRNGLRATVLHQPDLAQVPTPAILGARVGVCGHFITLLERRSDSYLIGDPFTGTHQYTAEEFARTYGFSGAVFHFTPATGAHR